MAKITPFGWWNGVILMTDRDILVAVARADLIFTQALRWLLGVVICTVILLGAVLLVRKLAGYEPVHWIDYDAPGADITSEGPEDGDPWYNEG